MVEEGFVQLIQNTVATAFTPNVPGGYAIELPKDLVGTGGLAVPKAWTYMSISSEPAYVLTGQDGLTTWNVQIDCHGQTAADAFDLATAIDSVLRGGYQGTLPDSDSTVVQGIFRESHFHDSYSDVNRSFVRSLEYTVNYQQT